VSRPQWIARELPGGSRYPLEGDVLLGQVDLAVDHRWKIPLDLSKPATPRSF